MKTTRRGFIAAAGGFLAGLCGLRRPEVVAEEEEGQWVDLEGFEGPHCSCCSFPLDECIITVSLEGDDGYWVWNNDTDHWDRIEDGVVVHSDSEVKIFQLN